MMIPDSTAFDRRKIACPLQAGRAMNQTDAVVSLHGTWSKG